MTPITRSLAPRTTDLVPTSELGVFEVIRRLPVTTWSLRPKLALPNLAIYNETAVALHSIGRLIGWMEATEWIGPLAKRLAARNELPTGLPPIRITTAWLGFAGDSHTSIASVPPPPSWLPSIMSGWKVAVAFDAAAHPFTPDRALRAAAWTTWLFGQTQPFGAASEQLARAHAAQLIAASTALGPPLIAGTPHTELARSTLARQRASANTLDAYSLWYRAWLLEVAAESERILGALQQASQERARILEVAAAMRAPKNCIALAASFVAQPQTNVAEAARTMDMTFRAAQAIVDKFTSEKILRETTGRKRDRVFLCDALSDATIFGSRPDHPQ